MKPQLILDMPAEEYFAVKALSASGIKLLNSGPLEYWYYTFGPGSHQEGTAAMKLGTAKHLAGLEGLEAFRRVYVPAIDKRDYEGVLDSQEELKSWCKEHGLPVGGTKAVLCDRIFEATLSLPESEWPVLWMKEVESQKNCAHIDGQEILTQDDYKDALAKAKQIAPIIQKLRDGGGMPEVSIFWEQDGIPCKARFDFLSPGVVMDLKNIQNSHRISFDKLISKTMANSLLPIQAEFYLRGARAIQAAGLLPFEYKGDFVFNWLFLQSAGAPNMAIREYEERHYSLDTGINETTMAKIWASAAIDDAAALYVKYHESHGDGNPWHPPIDSRVMTDEMYPHWFFYEEEEEIV
jgi:hypothetical protein